MRRLRALVLASAMTVLASTLCASTGNTASSNGGSNLISNGNFVAGGKGTPSGWKVHTLPSCGFRYEVHPHSDGPAEFEFINEEPVESSLLQAVSLKPGWYSFSVEMKAASLGTEGAPPMLFARSTTLPLQTFARALDWREDWRTLRLSFRTGVKVPEVLVGFGLGSWGRPNTGRVLVRNPVLVASDGPAALRSSADLEVGDDPDLERIAETKYRQLYALREEKNSVPSAAPNSLLNARWSVIALYAAFLIIAALGWWLVSPVYSNTT